MNLVEQSDDPGPHRAQNPSDHKMKSPLSVSHELATRWIRPSLRRLAGYVPGEQPRVRGLVKLNTNENPYPPSPRVLEALRGAIDGKLRLYPNPTAEPVRGKLAVLHKCRPENIIIGNGSDELLALATRAFVEPVPISSGGTRGKALDRATIQAFIPSYSLYPVLAGIHGARFLQIPLDEGFQLPSLKALQARARNPAQGRIVKSTEDPRQDQNGKWNFNAALSLITTPNAPTGRGFEKTRLEDLCDAQDGVVVLDEAYVDFAHDNAMDLALAHPNILVARTFSKAFSLCSLRVGYMVGNPILIEALHKIRDSYNVNGLGQVAALATLSDLPYYRSQWKKIVATREQTSLQLSLLGFRVFPSQTNFLFTQPPAFFAEKWNRLLRDRKILVRWFQQEDVSQFLRITVGSDSDMEALVSAVKQILKRLGRQ